MRWCERTPRLLCAAALALLTACQDEPTVWSIGLYRGETPFDLTPAAENPVFTAEQVDDIPARFVADPFLIRRGGEIYLYFEVWNRATDQGDIACAVSKDGRSFRYLGVVLDEPFHLAYPFVFEHQGNVYLIPESRGKKEIRLYQATDFPRRFAFKAVLRSGQRFADSSLLQWQGTYYLLTSTRNDRLEVYYADALTGPYHRHPQSPVMRNEPCAARGGGPVTPWRDGLIRFAQCDVPVYGTSVRAFEITTLTRDRYAERELRSRPILQGSGSGWNAEGMHHVAPLPWREGFLAAVDGWRYEEH